MFLLLFFRSLAVSRMHSIRNGLGRLSTSLRARDPQHEEKKATIAIRIGHDIAQGRDMIRNVCQPALPLILYIKGQGDLIWLQRYVLRAA